MSAWRRLSFCAGAAVVCAALWLTFFRSSQGPPPTGGTHLVLSHSLLAAVEPCGCMGDRAGGGAGRLRVVRRLRAELDGPVTAVEGGNFLSGGAGPWDRVVLDSLVDLFRRERTKVVCLGSNEIPRLDLLLGAGLPLACLNLATKSRTGVAPWLQVGNVLVTSLIDGVKLGKWSDEVADPESSYLKLLRFSEEDRSRIPLVFLHADGDRRRYWLKRIALGKTPMFVVDVHNRGRASLGSSRCGPSVVIRSEAQGKQICVLTLGEAKGPVLGLRRSAWISVSRGREELESGSLAYELGLCDVTFDPKAKPDEWTQHYRDGLRRRVSTSAEEYRGFVGSGACAACHTKESARWRESLHAVAMDSLKKVRMDHRADCYACHVTADLNQTAEGMLPGLAPAHLANVGCESCHGRGREHIADPRGSPMMRTPSADVCVRCHFGKFAPNFDYETMLPMAICQPSDAPRRRLMSFPLEPSPSGPR